MGLRRSKPVQRSARQLCLRFLLTLATFRRGKVVAMAGDVQSLLRQLEGVAEEIRRRYRAEIVGIFGSYVRGEQRETSDLDVLVRFTPGATLFDLVGLADFLEERLGIRVDIVPVDALREEIRDRVLQEAVYL
ncbi:putative nucleotidyltransferase [Chloracidobacterium thermophilum B]|uniref:Putative nucleotidyltransferase n=2 Tax=Chloracidobacterium thermophilum TaxID=458033 RepID=G2LHM5_CHLTF|nr:putative nucleotidyltransferase [Chloracidobacterium thermophilum B]